MSTDGQKVAWSIADYLASLENAVNELLKENSKPAKKEEFVAEVIEPDAMKQ